VDIFKNRSVAVGVVLIALLSACATSSNDSSSLVGKCPQPRFTDKAPESVYNLKNPLQNSASVLEAGEELFLETSARVPCASCHGDKGDGRGRMASMFDPPPRNFCCAKTVDDVSDGQLFWIIKNGSPGTSMPAFNKLSDEQIWQLVHYIRKLAKEATL
jgi:mono/diheme cytochrome c family protein